MLFFGKQEEKHTCKQCQQKMFKAVFTIDPDKLCYKKMKSIVLIFFCLSPPPFSPGDLRITQQTNYKT